MDFHSLTMRDMGISPKLGYLIGGPNNKDCSILGPILGSPYFGETTIFTFLRSTTAYVDLGFMQGFIILPR